MYQLFHNSYMRLALQRLNAACFLSWYEIIKVLWRVCWYAGTHSSEHCFWVGGMAGLMTADANTKLHLHNTESIWKRASCFLFALSVIPLFTSIFTSAENFLFIDVKSYLFKEIDFPFCHVVGGFHFFSMCCENKLAPTSDVRLVIHHSQHSRAFIPFLCQIDAVMVYQTDRLQKLFLPQLFIPGRNFFKNIKRRIKQKPRRINKYSSIINAHVNEQLSR